ncbi:tetratricopeptide (TPR) repeat protein [Lactobacillus colini]|uniref:Tetratricopeptide (TPR) repeat protein n=1 Tax=Lactobacillus colini TaxID=1819254 RepID=A0ABS4MDM2_9LACO|nr:CDC27 family protein [Lactobacillus colini]MBP2057789.1 tetratricopeptide (TPR) repeat protein [Lactobacillus colini]
MNKKIAKLYNSGKTENAIHLLIKEIDSHPKSVDNYLQLSTYLIEQNSPDQALELLQKAQSLVDKPGELTYNIAVCYYMQGEYQKSIALLNTLPNNDETLYQKALVFMKLGQYQKALAYALTIKLIDERTLELLGDIWLSLGNLQQANTSYQRISSDKRTAKVNFLLGLTVLDQDRDLAQKYFDLSKQKDPAYFANAQKQYSALMQMIRGKNGKN